jgi:hypothetical protein
VGLGETLTGRASQRVGEGSFCWKGGGRREDERRKPARARALKCVCTPCVCVCVCVCARAREIETERVCVYTP